MNETDLSPELQTVVGFSRASPVVVLKKVLEYIDSNAHQDFQAKRLICDENLKKLFGKDTFDLFEVPELLSPHFMKK
ncbi:hypothetical protein PTKIN_Ptkin05aG0219500 [Pterospermum kingtungense]